VMPMHCSANIGADGKYTTDPYVKDVSDTPGAISGTGAGSFVPPAVALAVSLMTGRRGAGGRGRFYLPQPVIAMGADQIIPLANAEAVRTRTAQFIAALNNQPGLDEFPMDVHVISSKGFSTKVNAVRVGRAHDTMRSRRRSLDEAYTLPAAVS